MSKPKTCKTCEHWKQQHPKGFVHVCQCPVSINYKQVMWETNTCDKHQSNDKQREMELKA